jgi:ribosomal protein S17E
MLCDLPYNLQQKQHANTEENNQKISIFDKYINIKSKNIQNCMGAFLTNAMLNARNMFTGSGRTR